MTFLHRWDKALWPSCKKAKSRSMTGLHYFWKHKETAVYAWRYLCGSSVCMSHSWPWAPIGGTYYMESYVLPDALLQPLSLPPWLACHSNRLIPSFAGSDFLPCECSIPFPHRGLECATYTTHSDTHFYYFFNVGPFSHFCFSQSWGSKTWMLHTNSSMFLLGFFFPYSERNHTKKKIIISVFYKPILYSLPLAFP